MCLGLQDSARRGWSWLPGRLPLPSQSDFSSHPPPPSQPLLGVQFCLASSLGLWGAETVLHLPLRPAPFGGLLTPVCCPLWLPGLCQAQGVLGAPGDETPLAPSPQPSWPQTWALYTQCSEPRLLSVRFHLASFPSRSMSLRQASQSGRAEQGN